MKQLKLHLPNPQPAYRQHFPTTRSPPSSSSSSAFPISRLAMAPSLTPSKWKNREEPQCTPIPDPEILPYLDAVPIQLLPLLDLAQSEPKAEASHSSFPPPTESCTTSAVVPDPPPLLASPTITRPCVPPPLPSPPKSLPTSQLRKKPNFAFLPLLPIQDEVNSVTQTFHKPPPPRKKLNMTFVPLLPVSEPTQLPYEASTHSPAPGNPEMTPTGSTRSLSESDCTSDITSGESEGDQLLKGTHGQLCLLPLFRAPSPSSTPSLSSASDTGTESEAPSTSNPSSPSELATAEMLNSYFAYALEASREPNDINPYFPLTTEVDPVSLTSRSHLPLQSAEHHYVAGDSNPEQDRSITLGQFPHAEGGSRHSLTMRLKTKLQAIPSPSLMPPSPFSLNPPSNGASPIEGVGISGIASPPTPTSTTAIASPSQEIAPNFVPTSRRASNASRGKSSLSFSSSITIPGVSPALSTMSGFSSVSDTPELTIERMREMNLGASVAAIDFADVLGPSIRRKNRE